MSCRDEVLKALDEGKLPGATRAEAEALIAEIENIRGAVTDRSDGIGENFRQEVQKHIADRRYDRMAKAMQAKESLLKLQGNIDYASQPAFEDMPGQAILGKLVGGHLAYSEGGNRGTANIGAASFIKKIQGLATKLREAGLYDISQDSLIDREAAQELYLIDEKRSGETKNPQAMELAKIVRGSTDMLITEKRAAGSLVKRAKNYIVKTTHDFQKVLEAGFDQWSQDVLTKIDVQKTFGNTTSDRVNSALQQIYDGIVSGDVRSLDYKSAEGVNYAEQQAQSRSLIFKDGYSWFDYNKDYGTGNLMQTLFKEIKKSSHQTAMMEAFGANPERGFNRFVTSLENSNRSNPEALSELKSKQKQINGAFQYALGFSDIPGTQMAAKIGYGARVAKSLAVTGQAAISTMTDLPFSASKIVSSGGSQSIFGEGVKQFGDFLSNVSKDNRAEIGRKMGVQIDDVLNHFKVAYLGGTEPGIMSTSMQMFSKLNLMDTVDNASAATGAKALGEMLARSSGTEFNALDDRSKLTFQRFGFDDKSWKLASMATEEVLDRKLMTPEAVHGLTDEQVRSVYPEGNPDRIRMSVANNLLAMSYEYSSAAASRNTYRIKAQMFGDSIDDGSWGTVQRLVNQFKGPMISSMRTAAETFMSNPETKPTTLKAAFSGAGDFKGLLSLITFATALGYFKGVAKDAAEFKTPRDPTDPKTIRDAFLESGVAGIYGDLLVKEMGRGMGIDSASVLLGPVPTEALSISNDIRKAVSGNGSTEDAWKHVWDNVPGHNLFYLKGALDNGINQNMREWMSPGYKARVEARMNQNRGLFDRTQQYFSSGRTQ